MGSLLDPRAVGQAVRAVLAGQDLDAVAARYRISESELADAEAAYRAAGDAAMLRLVERPDWHQVMLAGPSPTGRATHHGLATTGFAALAAGLAHAEAECLIKEYHFLRKNGGLRLRIAPNEDLAARRLAEILDSLTAHGEISGWVVGSYEPEEYAFGGPAAMRIAHRLFCADSRVALFDAGRADRRTVPQNPGPRERAILLAGTLLRAAGLDWYEQGAVWALVAEHRPPPALPSAARLAEASTTMRQLMTTDAATQAGDEGWEARVAAFDTAGRELARLARNGQLQRGLRAVLTHHLIFTFNRVGLSAPEQAALAHLAKEVIMHQHEIVSNPGNGESAASLGRMDSTTCFPATEDEAGRLRSELVAQLRQRGAVDSPRVAEAFTAVPRHLFVPGTPLDNAYTDTQIFTKHTAATGEAISAASQPSIVAMMLQQLDAQPGDNVLEAGAGTGYNAALLGHLVGPRGHVTTLDVDDDLVEDARAHLRAAGVANVTVLLCDGALGHPGGAPYQRIIATVGAGDIPDGWFNQLAPDSLLLVPLRIRGGVSRSIAFVREAGRAGHWRAVSSEMCTFMPLRRGIADDPRRIIPLTEDGHVSVHVYNDLDVDPDALATVLKQEATEVSSGVLFRKGDPWEFTNLYLTCALPGGLVRMPMAGPALESGLVRPQFPWGAMAAVDKNSVAYLTLHAGEDETGLYWEAGVIGHGPNGGDLAAQVVEHLSVWNSDYRDAHPTIRLARHDYRHSLTGQFIIDKASTRLAITWE